MTVVRSEGLFTAPASSEPVLLVGPFNLSLAGSFTASVRLERSFDGGGSWHPLSRDAGGAEAAWQAPVSLSGEEPERGILYRVTCTSHESGSVSYRISQ